MIVKSCNKIEYLLLCFPAIKNNIWLITAINLIKNN